ncbi:hypothetical protein LCGC14_0728140 [marine sediment metagenome]|uniref:DUF5131 family protein n=1 Tax=marine sediment metagenome TaxID=412755 RepID=A0A0F9SVL1_9ZZZZ
MPRLNPTGIDWAEFTWNPIVGCDGGCSYCYARKMAARFHRGCEDCRTFTPHVHPERWDAPSKRIKPAQIFTESMGDLYHPHTRWEWRNKVYQVIKFNQQHTFLLLTKRPDNMWDVPEYPNMWNGVSVTSYLDTGTIGILKQRKKTNRFVSFEPLTGSVTTGWSKLDLTGIDWVIIGAQTNPTIMPDPKWVKAIVDQCIYLKIPVFLKNNLNWPIKIQEYPGG